MSAYLVWRLIKFIAFALWGAGVFSLIRERAQKKGLQTLYFLIVPSFSVLWISGWLMMKLKGFSMAEPWISNTMLFSLISLIASFQVAHHSKLRSIAKIVMVIGLSMATAAMIFREPEQAVLGLGISGVLGLFLGIFLKEDSDSDPEGTNLDIVEKGFTWIAWGEGATVLILFGVFMPFKYALEINIDFGTGVIAWTHGVFVIIYLIALTYAKLAFKWSWLDFVLGGFVSFFPFGTFWFEKRMRKRTSVLVAK